MAPRMAFPESSATREACDGHVTKLHPGLLQMLIARNGIPRLAAKSKPELRNDTESKMKLPRPKSEYSKRDKDQLPTPPQRMRSLSAIVRRMALQEPEVGGKAEPSDNPIGRRESRDLPLKDFDALNRPRVPIPTFLNGRRAPSAAYKKTDMEQWKRQVVKVVPKRVHCTIAATRYPIRLYDMPHTDFRRMSEPNFRQLTGSIRKHYVIDPEWFSERSNGRYLEPGHGPMAW